MAVYRAEASAKAEAGMGGDIDGQAREGESVGNA